VIIFEVRLQDSSQVTLAEDDHVIETFSANGSDDSFDVRVLPERPSRDRTLRRPGHLSRLFHFQYNRNPLLFHRMTVSGWTR